MSSDMKSPKVRLFELPEEMNSGLGERSGQLLGVFGSGWRGVNNDKVYYKEQRFLETQKNWVRFLTFLKTIKMEKKEGWPSVFKLIALDIKV